MIKISKTKADLIERIEVLEHNLKGAKWENDVLKGRLKNIHDRLEVKGFTTQELIDLMKFDFENI